MTTSARFLVAAALALAGCGDDTAITDAGDDADSGAATRDGGDVDGGSLVDAGPRPDAGTPSGRRIVVDVANPRFLFYDDGSPHYLCAPGDPEDFLYRGTRNANGTRDGDQDVLIDKLRGTGANGIYFQSIRSHGGDGMSDHNPFVDSDPAMGLDGDILAQWDGWLRALDEAGIVTYFFVYDDSACVWDCGADAVPAEEEAYLRAIVDRFETIGHLVWVVAEEYSERYSAARASNIAAVIRDADDFDHPIGVHKLNGTSFAEFATDANVDQFTMQTTAGGPDALHGNVLTAVTAAAGAFNVNMSEGHVGGSDHGTGDAGRRNNWATALAGAYVMALGWDIASNTVADLEQCGHLVRFMEATRFDTMLPDDSLALGDTTYVLTNPTDTFILYAASRTGDLGVRGIDAGDFDLTWIDTVDGDVVDEPAVGIGGGDVMLTPPTGFGAEVAVYVRRTGR
jgi:hypothetical protein